MLHSEGESLLGCLPVGDRQLAQLFDDQQVPISLVTFQRLAAGPLVIQELGHLQSYATLTSYVLLAPELPRQINPQSGDKMLDNVQVYNQWVALGSEFAHVCEKGSQLGATQCNLPQPLPAPGPHTPTLVPVASSASPVQPPM